jgi:hypothetical protein
LLKISPSSAKTSHLHHTCFFTPGDEAEQCAPLPRLGCSQRWRRHTLSWRVERRRSSERTERKPQMADALLLLRRFHAPSTAATSSSASSSPSFRCYFSPALLRGARLAAAQPRSRQLAGLKVCSLFVELGVALKCRDFVYPWPLRGGTLWFLACFWSNGLLGALDGLPHLGNFGNLGYSWLLKGAALGFRRWMM